MFDGEYGKDGSFRDSQKHQNSASDAASFPRKAQKPVYRLFQFAPLCLHKARPAELLSNIDC